MSRLLDEALILDEAAEIVPRRAPEGSFIAKLISKILRRMAVKLREMDRE
jgi:hypothetical protein